MVVGNGRVLDVVLPRLTVGRDASTSGSTVLATGCVAPGLAPVGPADDGDTGATFVVGGGAVLADVVVLVLAGAVVGDMVSAVPAISVVPGDPADEPPWGIGALPRGASVAGVASLDT